MARKTSDPVLIAMLDERVKLHQDCDRLYSQMRHAFTALERTRKRMVRLSHQIARHKRRETVCA